MGDRGVPRSGGLALVDQPAGGGHLLGIGEAALRAGVSERALRYYQELELITPSGRTPGGMRRYSEEDLARVARIRELQSLLGLNLDEIAAVLRNEDRIDEIRAEQPVSVPRNTWIAEAVVKRVEKEAMNKDKRNVAQ